MAYSIIITIKIIYHLVLIKKLNKVTLTYYSIITYRLIVNTVNKYYNIIGTRVGYATTVKRYLPKKNV